MHPTQHLINTQQKCRQLQRRHRDCYQVFNLLTSDALVDTVEALLPPHRERLFPPTETLAMFITQALSMNNWGQIKLSQFEK